MLLILDQVDEVILPVGKQTPEQMKKLHKDYQIVKEREKARFEEYKVALEGGNLNEIRKAIDRYLKSGPARVVAAVKGNLAFPYRDRLTLSQSYELGKSLKLHQPIEEPVRVYGKKKSSGGERPICVFGHKHRLGQRLVRNLLTERFEPQPWQYTYRGPAAAIKYIRSLNPTAELYARKLDIKDFYGSFEETKLVSFLNDIASDVVRYVILCDDNALTAMDGSSLYKDLSQQAHRGVAQGSALSPLIGALAVAQLNWSSVKEVQMLNYADDFLVIAPTLEVLDTATQALTAAVAALPGGHFELLPKKMSMDGSATSTFGAFVTFLGYDMRVEKDGSLEVGPCTAASKRFDEITGEIIRRIKKSIKRLKAKSVTDDPEGASLMVMAAGGYISQLYHYVKGWESAFKETDPIVLNGYVGSFYEKVESFSAQIGMKVADVIKIEVDVPDVFEISGTDYVYEAKLIADA